MVVVVDVQPVGEDHILELVERCQVLEEKMPKNSTWKHRSGNCSKGSPCGSEAIMETWWHQGEMKKDSFVNKGTSTTHAVSRDKAQGPPLSSQTCNGCAVVPTLN